MTTLKEQLQTDLMVNLKARNELQTTVLRSVIGAIQTAEKSGKAAVVFDDAQVEALLTKEFKKRKDTSAEWTKVGVVDRAERENAEAEVLAKYIPAPLTSAELEVIVNTALAGVEAPSMKDFGKIMKEVTAATGSRADGKVISELVRAKIQ